VSYFFDKNTNNKIAKGPNTKPMVPQKTGLASYFFAILWQMTALMMKMDNNIMVKVIGFCISRNAIAQVRCYSFG
jgi:hypothetical protein